MVRETRGVARDAKEAADAGAKRKRRPSSPAPPPAPIKVVLPALGVNGQQHGAKRAKVEAGADTDDAVDEDAEEDDGDEGDGVDETAEDVEDVRVPGEEKTRPRVGQADGRRLSAEVRDALATVIAQMAAGLPSPLDGILTLWLPPSFREAEENTLGYVLRQDGLTWERLVDTLHVFTENLLLPCSYPNPFPSLARIRLPSPPLPAHYPPLHVYTFCAALHPLVLSIEPGRPAVDLPQAAERWALVQKTPPSASSGGEWFTSAVDLGSAEKIERAHGAGLLGLWAAAGDKFGYATPLSLQTTSQPPAYISRLGETVIRRASLKAQRWKEARLVRRAGGGLGAVQAPVRAVVANPSASSWAPSFAPTMDSGHTAGAGWDATVAAMHEKARARAWKRGVRDWARGGEGDGWHGVLDARHLDDMGDSGDAEAARAAVDGEPGEAGGSGVARETSGAAAAADKGKGRSIDDVLADNAALIAELQAWQDLRLVKGDEEWITQREQLAADALFASLGELAARAPPAALLSSPSPSAHALAARHIPTRGPLVRGTLDPRRPAALHDNTTVRLSSHALALAAAPPAASPHLPPPGAPAQPAPGTAPPPHTLPPGMRARPAAPPPPHARPAALAYAPPAQGYRPMPAAASPSPSPSPAPHRTQAPGTPSPAPTAGAAGPRPGPGPSGLRQSYGPGAYGR